VQIAAVAPGLFTLNSAGLAAAIVTAVGPGNVQTFPPVTAPINVSSGQVYLSLYGTGIRGAGSNVSVTIKGLNVPVAYAGPQNQIAGLDQVNVLLPATLAGSGTVSIALTAGSMAANVVHVVIQ
jgi:uncharacterized protein (TIGR03437 family)